ncbi:MAG: AMP-binding protein [Spirochaetales bacterium]|nr:AMP-binding protein [Spirochaetales bacterium]
MKETVINMLTQAREKYCDMPYVCQKLGPGEGMWKEWSFGEVDRESDLFAAALIKKGFRPGESIALLSEGRYNWVIAEFGILKARCCSVPLSSKLKEGEIPFRLNHSESKGVIVSEYTFEQVLLMKEKLDRTPFYIVLSDDTDLTDQLGARFGLTEGEDFIRYADFITAGEDCFREVEGELLSRIESIDEKDTVTISYTSGTTGNPKGIMLTHRNYWVNSHDAVKVVQIPEGVGSLIILPLDHSFAHTVGIYISLLRGLSMSFIDNRGGGMAALRNLTGNLRERNPYFLLTVPALSGNFMKKMKEGIASQSPFVQKIFESGLKWGIRINGNGFNRTPLSDRILGFFPYKLASLLIFPKLRQVFGDSLQFCVGGGALLEIKQQEFYRAIGLPVYQGYGLTEAAPIICANSPEKAKFGSSGVILPSIECRIMEDENGECPPGKAGEIVIRGGNVMKGYFKNPEATAEVLKGEWLWTGDLGYRDQDGFLVVTGRAKALLISADGEKYSPEEIEEAVMNASDLVDQIMVYNDMRKYTVGLIVLNGGSVAKLVKEKGIANAGELLKAVHDSIYSFKGEGRISPLWVPSTFALIEEPFSEDQGLINSTLKLVRHRVVDYYKERIEGMYGGDEGTDFFNEKNLNAVEKFLK